MVKTIKRELLFLIFLFLWLPSCHLISQIPVEVFTGHEKATIDVMFFRFIKRDETINTKFLFFNRNRASIDYSMTATTNLPLFGFTEALSYNHPKLKGFAPVAVAQVLSRGVYPKVGFQFAKIKSNLTLFSWLVSETASDPNIDFFILARFTPKLSKLLSLFSQAELVSAFPLSDQKNISLTERFRIGLKINAFQFGLGTDLTQTGRGNYLKTNNWGGFLRYEF